MPPVVTCLLVSAGKLLILKRSTQVRTYKEYWGGVAGYIENKEQPYETALKEIHEEVGLEEADVRLTTQGEPVKITDMHEGKRYDWVIHPFVFHVKKKEKIHIDWEHSEYKWISPAEISQYQTVPHLKEIVRQHLQETT
ncbi:MAG: NUDIX domain-containing protein [Methanobacteriota archaeon]